MSQELRSDARDNRDRIFAAARRLLAEHGLDVGMREIARSAEVGPATLYRRFPTRRALIDAAFAVELEACRRIVEEGAADVDAWRGFTTALRRLVVLGVRNRGFVDAFLAEADGADVAAHRAELLSTLERLARRAVRDGRLRSDFVIGDLVLLLRAGRGLAGSRPAAREEAARRFGSFAVDALRAPGPTPARVAR